MTPDRLEKIRAIAAEGDSVTSPIAFELAEEVRRLNLQNDELRSRMRTICAAMDEFVEAAGVNVIGLERYVTWKKSMAEALAPGGCAEKRKGETEEMRVIREATEQANTRVNYEGAGSVACAEGKPQRTPEKPTQPHGDSSSSCSHSVVETWNVCKDCGQRVFFPGT